MPSATPAASPPPAADGFDEFLYLGAGCGGDDGDDDGGGGGGGAFHTPPKKFHMETETCQIFLE